MGQTSQGSALGLAPLASIVSALVCAGLGFVDIAVQAPAALLRLGSGAVFCQQAVEQVARSRQPVPQRSCPCGLAAQPCGFRSPSSAVRYQPSSTGTQS